MESFSGQLSKSYQNLVDKLGSWLDAFILQIPNLLIALVVGLFAYFLSGYVRKIATKTAKKITHNNTVLNLIANLSTVIFGIIAIFLILSVLNLGDTINKILATAGVLGLAVGLALQDPMNNLFSGVFMSVRDLYKIGDLIESNGHFGTILDIDLRATKLMLPSGQEVVIPNKDVIQNPLKNFTVSGVRRVDVNCGVSYGDDLEKVEELVIEAIRSRTAAIKEKPVEVFFGEFGDSSINFTARYWIDTIGQRDYLKEKSMAVKAIKQIFDANDIMIPFPIRTLDFGIRGGLALSEAMPKFANQNNGKVSSVTN